MKYRGLEWILIDEMLMVINDLLKYVHLHLQDIKHNKESFGGVCVIAIGDLYQLQPEKVQFIFTDFRHDCGPLVPKL